MGNVEKKLSEWDAGKEELLKLNRICEDVRHREDQLANAQTTARALKQVAAQKSRKKHHRFHLFLAVLRWFLVWGLASYRCLPAWQHLLFWRLSLWSFLYCKRKKQEEDLSEQPLLELEQEMERAKREIEQGNEKISFVLSAYFPEGISGDFRDVIQQMQMDTIAYETHQAKSEAVGEEDEVRYQTLQKSLREFMDGYVEMGISEERFAFGLSKLRSELKQYRRLCEKLESFWEQKKKYEQAKEEFVLSGKEYGLILKSRLTRNCKRLPGRLTGFRWQSSHGRRQEKSCHSLKMTTIWSVFARQRRPGKTKG